MADQPTVATDRPYIPASESLAEITVKAVVLGVLLSVLLGGANAYLGLFAGLTVSASIPAAVISMAVLRLFRRSNILENNIVQTSASAGESLAAGVIFTIPALVLLGTWQRFNYWEVTMIAGLGGVIGVLFTIPLRRALVIDQPLRFPEGVATAEVLKVGDRGGNEVKYIAQAGLVGALFKFGSTGLRLWGESIEWARYTGGSIAYFGTNLSPALVAVGYIVGLNIAALIFLGGVINWWVAIPIAASLSGVDPNIASVDAAAALWSGQTRYLGVGAMVVGGLWALIRLRKSLVSGIRSGLTAYRAARQGGAGVAERTERDTPMQWVGIALLIALIPLYFMFEHFTGSFAIAAVMAVAMLVAGFLFSAVAAYMAGLVGSSNNPISGVTIATILGASLLLALLLGTDSPIGAASAIFIGAVVCCAAAIAGDNMQDLKAGHILGATPYKQQIMQGIGVIAAALVMAPLLTLLQNAYGIGTRALPAPQAGLMAAVAEGVFGGRLPWGMVIAGMLIAVAIILLDVWLESRDSAFRTPVLAVAVGIYLPFQLSAAIFIGGLIAWAGGRVFQRLGTSEDKREQCQRHGLLFAAGLITGEALVGILMAIPIVIAGRADVLAFWGTHEAVWPGAVLLVVVLWALHRVGTGPARSSS